MINLRTRVNHEWLFHSFPRRRADASPSCEHNRRRHADRAVFARFGTYDDRIASKRGRRGRLRSRPGQAAHRLRDGHLACKPRRARRRSACERWSAGTLARAPSEGVHRSQSEHLAHHGRTCGRGRPQPQLLFQGVQEELRPAAPLIPDDEANHTRPGADAHDERAAEPNRGRLWACRPVRFVPSVPAHGGKRRTFKGSRYGDDQSPLPSPDP